VDGSGLVVERCDILIVGAGVAGASLAWSLAQRESVDVVVVEQERGPAHHASGRSARTLLEIDRNPVVRRLKIAGARFLRRPPAGFCSNPLLDVRGALRLLDRDELETVERSLTTLRDEGLELDLLAPREACLLCDVLDRNAFAAAVHLPHDGFIDVDGLMRGFTRGAAEHGARFHFGRRIGALEPEAEGWVVEAGDERIFARVLVNAAGAWAGEIGSRAGCAPLRLRPLRRSLVVCAAPGGLDAARWPLVWSDAHRLYFRPLERRLMVCPMDETPSEPCDAEEDEHAIEAALARLPRLAPRLASLRPHERWAGLRTFSDDGAPVVGFDPQAPGFFWLAGQGGCGMETAAALSEISADLLLEGSTARFDASSLDPRRFHGR